MSTDVPVRGQKNVVDKIVAYASLGAIALFVVVSLVMPDGVSNFVNSGLKFCAKYFGLYWQIVLLGTFLMALVMMFTPWAKAYVGATRVPEFSAFKWVAMIMCTLLAGGGVFWAAAEPLYHYLYAPPPLAGQIGGEADRPVVALAQSFVHWGFLAWSILGTTGAVILARANDKGLPLRPRSLLYPISEKLVYSWVGKVADIVAIIAVVAGTVGPIGFLGLQVAYGLHDYLGWANNYPLQLGVIILLVTMAAGSVATGLDKGIQILSRLNVWIAIILMVVVLALTSVVTTFKWFGQAYFLHVKTFFATTLFTGDAAWASAWTIFFFGWFLGYGPLMAIFVARISIGRSLRQLFFTVAIVAPTLTMFWFSVLGGQTVAFEVNNPGSISGPLDKGGLPAAIIAMTHQLPGGAIIGGAFLVLTITFVSTTADSMSYSIAQSCTLKGHPPRWLRSLWALFMGVAAAVLISIGEGGISALQSFIVITAVPVGFLMLPSLVSLPMVMKQMYEEQRDRGDWEPKEGEKTASELMQEQFSLPTGWKGELVPQVNIVHIHLPRFDQYREGHPARRPRPIRRTRKSGPTRTVTVTQARAVPVTDSPGGKHAGEEAAVVENPPVDPEEQTPTS